MKTKTSLLGAILGLLLFCLPAIGQAQTTSQYSTPSQVADYYNTLVATGRGVPASIMGAWSTGSGITFYSDGGYQFDGETETINYDSSSAAYNGALSISGGDSILAIEYASGLLSPAEMQRMQGNDSFHSGMGWGTLSNFRGFFGFSYTYQGTGGHTGGGYQN